MEIRTCSKCGFLLDARPNSANRGGICLACLNKDRKKSIDWESRQSWLTEYIKEKSRPASRWDVAVGVSGGKDSCAIVSRLVEEHEVNPERMLLVHVCDEFTPSEAGRHNLDNLARVYNVDVFNVRYAPGTFAEKAREGFYSELNPLKWLELQLYNEPMRIARAFSVPFVFMGENSAFEYGESEECAIFHPSSDEETKVIYMGAIWPYSTTDSLDKAKEMGFRTLDEYDDWFRQGCADSFTQIDSKGYMVHIWLKFIKFGFQRVSDMACRFVREGLLTRDQAMQMIKDSDWICDPLAKKDFCRAIGITNEEFDKTVDRFANTSVLTKDANGNWRRKDLI